MELPQEFWDLGKKLRKKKKKSISPTAAGAAAAARRGCRGDRVVEDRIVCIAPKTFRDAAAPSQRRLHFLDSVTIMRRPWKDSDPVMTRVVKHEATHRFDTCDFQRSVDELARLDTNALVKSIAYKDPNTNVNHIVSFENVYEFEHEFEEADPSVAVSEAFKQQQQSRVEVEKQVQMAVEVLTLERDKQLAECKFVYHFQHKVRLYCPRMKLQTWSTVLRPSEVMDYCDVDPYRFATSALNPVLLQVHYQRITHYVKLVHLLCTPRRISFLPQERDCSSSLNTGSRELKKKKMKMKPLFCCLLGG